MLKNKIDLSYLSSNHRNLIIWDNKDNPPISEDYLTILWSSYIDINKKNIISIPRIVEEYSDILRSQFLSWVYDLGETVIHGKSVTDHLEVKKNFSYWWMTSIAQKFNISSTSQINNAIKLIALEHIIKETSIKSIQLFTNNNKLSDVVRKFCRVECIQFTRNRPYDIAKIISFFKYKYSKILPAPLRALIYLFWFIVFRMKRVRQNIKIIPNAKANITFIDIFTHLDKDTFLTKKFVSNYWTSLVDKLLSLNIETHWIHNYFKHRDVPTVAHAEELSEALTVNSCGLQTHILVESHISIDVLLKSLWKYFKLLICGLGLLSISKYFKARGSTIDFWPLFKEEWISSIRGQEAVINILRLCIYDKIFCSLPHQKKGVYIQENQPWELALIYCWRSSGHGELIGVPHSTVRYWDLRYFYDPRTFVKKTKNPLPMPEVVAVNAPIAKKLYIDAGYPEHSIREVEALRYLYIADFQPECLKKDDNILQVLICGDFLKSTTYKMLSWISLASKKLPPNTVFTIKPHPAYDIDLGRIRDLELIVDNSPILSLMKTYDVVFVSNTTSVAVDAYCTGVSVLQMIDGESLNTSPLRGIGNVKYIESADALAKELQNARLTCRAANNSYFYSNKSLHSWIDLLGLDSK
ncbi:MAG: hypothetical protein RBT37_00550 [Dissulfurispiraceae bacterium]|jgi:surface carbohydrate biosynthesis protein (TIGR04326 family)|nr:hypothetical protein [Dissulfurispiraceae bacterium]